VIKDEKYNKYKPVPTTTYDIHLPHEKIFGSDGFGSTKSYWIYTEHPDNWTTDMGDEHVKGCGGMI